MVLFGVCCCVPYLCTGVHLIGEGGLVSGCDAANLRIEISAGALVGCGFSLSRPREGRQLPSERDANGEF